MKKFFNLITLALLLLSLTTSQNKFLSQQTNTLPKESDPQKGNSNSQQQQIKAGLIYEYSIKKDEKLQLQVINFNQEQDIVIQGQGMNKLIFESNISGEKKLSIGENLDSQPIDQLPKEKLQEFCKEQQICEITFTISLPTTQQEPQTQNFLFSFTQFSLNKQNQQVFSPLYLPNFPNTLKNYEAINQRYYQKENIFQYKIELPKSQTQFLSLYAQPQKQSSSCQIGLNLTQDTPQSKFPSIDSIDLQETSNQHFIYDISCENEQLHCTYKMTIYIKCNEDSTGSFYLNGQQENLVSFSENTIFQTDPSSNNVQRIFIMKSIEKLQYMSGHFKKIKNFVLYNQDQKSQKYQKIGQFSDNQAFNIEKSIGNHIIFLYNDQKTQHLFEYQTKFTDNYQLTKDYQPINLGKKSQKNQIFLSYEIQNPDTNQLNLWFLQQNSNFVLEKMNFQFKSSTEGQKNEYIFPTPTTDPTINPSSLKGFNPNAKRNQWVLSKDILFQKGTIIMFTLSKQSQLQQNQETEEEENEEIQVKLQEFAVPESKIIENKTQNNQQNELVFINQSVSMLYTYQPPEESQNIVYVNVQNPMLIKDLQYELTYADKTEKGTIQTTSRASTNISKIQLQKDQKSPISLKFFTKNEDFQLGQYAILQFQEYEGLKEKLQAQNEAEIEIPVYQIPTIESSQQLLQGVSQNIQFQSSNIVKFCFLSRAIPYTSNVFQVMNNENNLEFSVLSTEIDKKDITNPEKWPKMSSQEIQKPQTNYISQRLHLPQKEEESYFAISLYVSLPKKEQNINNNNWSMYVQINEIKELYIKGNPDFSSYQTDIQTNELMYSYKFLKHEYIIAYNNIAFDSGNNVNNGKQLFYQVQDPITKELFTYTVSEQNQFGMQFDQYVNISNRQQFLYFFVYPQQYSNDFGYKINSNHPQNPQKIENVNQAFNDQNESSMIVDTSYTEEHLVYQKFDFSKNAQFEANNNIQLDLVINLIGSIKVDDILVEYGLFYSNVIPVNLKNKMKYSELENTEKLVGKKIQINDIKSQLKPGESTIYFALKVKKVQKEGDYLAIRTTNPQQIQENFLNGQSVPALLNSQFLRYYQKFTIQKSELLQKGSEFFLFSQNYSDFMKILFQFEIGNKQFQQTLEKKEIGAQQLANFDSKLISEQCKEDTCQISIFISSKDFFPSPIGSGSIYLSFQNKKEWGPFQLQANQNPKYQVLIKPDTAQSNDQNIQTYHYHINTKKDEQYFLMLSSKDFGLPNQFLIQTSEKQEPKDYPSLNQEELTQMFSESSKNMKTDLKILPKCDKNYCNQKFTVYVNLLEKKTESAFFIQAKNTNSFSRQLNFKNENFSTTPRQNAVFPTKMVYTPTRYKLFSLQFQNTNYLQQNTDRTETFVAGIYLIYGNSKGQYEVAYQDLEYIYSSEFTLNDPKTPVYFVTLNDINYSSFSVNSKTEIYESNMNFNVFYNFSFLSYSNGIQYKKLQLKDNQKKGITLAVKSGYQSIAQNSQLSFSFKGYKNSKNPQNLLYPTNQDKKYTLSGRSVEYTWEEDYDFILIRAQKNTYFPIYNIPIEALEGTGYNFDKDNSDPDDYDWLIILIVVACVGFIFISIKYCIKKKRERERTRYQNYNVHEQEQDTENHLRSPLSQSTENNDDQ